MVTTNLILIAAIGLVVLFITRNPLTEAIKELVELPPQSETSPQQALLLGLRSTNTLGLIDAAPGLTPLQTGLANLRDNLTFGGLLFQGTNTTESNITERILNSTTSIFNLSNRRIR